MIEAGKTINNKYKIIRKLGEGGMAKTYLAIDPNDKDKQLVVKVVQLKGLKEWKMLELFKREAKILKSLNHPKIPKYVDYFVEEQEDNIMYFLVYEYIEGESLSSFLDKGKIFSYEVVSKMMKQILEILVYLHDIVPPVVHRDINPNNIIRKDNGDVYLVDFGAVQDTIIKNTKLGGSTFVGTYGYIPLEQLSGKATPQSDLYALGMTAIKLLTGKSPHTFEMINLKPKYKNENDYNQLDKIINMMIELDLKKRIKSAPEVLYLLNMDESNITKHLSAINNSNKVMTKKIQPDKNQKLYLKKFHSVMITVKTENDKIMINIAESKLLRYWSIPIISSILTFLLMPFGIPYIPGFFGGIFFISFILLFILSLALKLREIAMIEIDNEKLSISTEEDRKISVPIEEIDKIYIERKVLNILRIRLNIEIVTKKDGLKKISIPDLKMRDANYISNLILKDIENRKQYLLK